MVTYILASAFVASVLVGAVIVHVSIFLKRATFRSPRSTKVKDRRLTEVPMQLPVAHLHEHIFATHTRPL